MSLDILYILHLILFGVAIRIGFMRGLDKIKNTRNGVLPAYKSHDNNNYFFLIDYD